MSNECKKAILATTLVAIKNWMIKVTKAEPNPDCNGKLFDVTKEQQKLAMKSRIPKLDSNLNDDVSKKIFVKKLLQQL